MITEDNEAPEVKSPDNTQSDEIRETIVVPFRADLTPSQIAKRLRQMANLAHALVANLSRDAAIGDGRNAGAGQPIMQQIFGAAGNLDAAALGIEQAQRQVLPGSQVPPNLRGPMGRA